MFDVRSLIAALGFARPRPRPNAGSYARAVAAHDAGRAAEALELLAAVPADGDDAVSAATVCNKRGVILVALGRRAEALTAFCEALDADERSAPALTNIGNLLLEDGHVRDAADYYEAAIRADEAYHLAYRNLGVALKRLGRRGEAVRALRSAARLESRSRVRRA